MFGGKVIQKDGELDRASLGRIVFADATQLDALNAIVHPAMMTRIGERIEEYQRVGSRWLVYEAALIIEKGLSPSLREVISVVTTPSQQLERLMARNPITEQEALDRIASQTDNETRRQASNHIVENDGSIDALMVEADRHLERLITTYGPL
jgi:dephospho-CoA kinase